MFILDPYLDFLPIPDPGVKKASDPDPTIGLRTREAQKLTDHPTDPGPEHCI
jgi:hypothetical protein